jgi:hypothetical protein
MTIANTNISGMTVGSVVIPTGNWSGTIIVPAPGITDDSIVFLSPQGIGIWRALVTDKTAGVGFSISYGGAPGETIAWQIVEPARE